MEYYITKHLQSIPSERLGKSPPIAQLNYTKCGFCLASRIKSSFCKGSARLIAEQGEYGVVKGAENFFLRGD